MMPEAHQYALYYLVAVIFILFAVIVGTITLSQLKRKKRENETPPSISSSEVVVSPSDTPTETPKKVLDLNDTLGATKSSFFGRMKNAFSRNSSSAALEEIEEILYTSDLGPRTVEKFMESLRGSLSRSELQNVDALKELLRSEFNSIFSKIYSAETISHQKISSRLSKSSEKPTVIMVVGVNGAGKTTSIGKLSAVLAQEGARVLVAAGDTFRAAAGSQLSVWTERAQVEIFSPAGVTDPSAVAFDAVSKAKGQGYDYVIIDTAGRLHTQANLMEELKKMKRVMTKVIADAPHETLIVLDANQGQNALQQAKEFNQALQLTGCILTKMDGTAKGGVALGLVHEVEIPIKLMGVGEKITDLRVFQPEEFTNSILG